MLARTLVPTALALAVLAVGCTRKTSDRDLTYLNPFQAIEKSNATPGFLDREMRTAWIDPRTPEQYAAEHIPGAISLPFPKIPTEAPIVLRDYNQFVVYDTDYDDTIGKAAAKRLMEEGFDNVYSLEGGLKAWKRDKNPTESSPGAAKPAEAKAATPAASSRPPSSGTTAPAPAQAPATAPPPAQTPATARPAPTKP